MKIEHGFQGKSINILTNKSLENVGKKMDFSDFLQKEQQQQTREQLNQLLEDIDEQGKKLLISKGLRELSTYKTLIRRFINEVVENALLLEDKYSYDKAGRKKRYKVLKEIDEKLMSLSEMILEKESDQIKLLEEMGDIRGLIVNLYY